MKKIFKMVALTGVCGALLLTACGKEDDNNGSDNGGSGGGGAESVEWVDLGLPSGLLWASCNLGATKPEGYGDYYAWGETETKSAYDWSTYKYGTGDDGGSLSTLSKYNTQSTWGAVDNLTTLEAMDDVATQKLGDSTRIPTETEWEELIENTTAEWTTVNGVKGSKFTASNGNSLFLPAAGCYDPRLDYVGEGGYYWSSSLYEYAGRAWAFYVGEAGQGMSNGDGERCWGLSVRAVRSQN